MREQRFATVSSVTNMCSRVFAKNNVTIWACVAGINLSNVSNMTTYHNSTYHNSTYTNSTYANSTYANSTTTMYTTMLQTNTSVESGWLTNVSEGWTEMNRTNSSVQQNRTRPSLLRKYDKYVRSELYNYLHAFWVVCVFLLLVVYLRHKRWTRKKCRVAHLGVPRQYRTRSAPRHIRTRSASVP